MIELCGKANKYRPAAICVLPEHVGICKQHLDSGIELASAAGHFPAPNGPLHERVAEIKGAVRDGATEIDVVFDFEAFK